MSTIGIHPRITLRHPNISGEDVTYAMRGMFAYKQRESGEWIAVGLDFKGRLLELVYQYDTDDDFFFVFHAFTPPSGKTLSELKLER